MKTQLKRMAARYRSMNRLARYSLILLLVAFLILVYPSEYSPFFITYRVHTYDGRANADLKNAFTAAQAFFYNHPGELAHLEVVKKYGYYPFPGVRVEIVDGRQDTFSLRVWQEQGDLVFTVDAKGVINKEEK